MRLYYDTEFSGLHQNTTFISLGIVAENGDYFYAEFNDYGREQLNDWLRENVISNLFFKKEVEERKLVFPKSMKINKWIMCGNTSQIVERLKEWLLQYDDVEMWSDCMFYDYVLFNQLFGGSLNSPVPYIHFDICTVMKIKNIDPDINREKYGQAYLIEDNYFSNVGKEIKHNALWDAYIIQACYKKLGEIK